DGRGALLAEFLDAGDVVREIGESNAAAVRRDRRGGGEEDGRRPAPISGQGERGGPSLTRHGVGVEHARPIGVPDRVPAAPAIGEFRERWRERLRGRSRRYGCR